MHALAALILAATTLSEPIHITEDMTDLDLTGTELVGPKADGDPDGFEGIGILIEGCRKVTIKGARLRGFKCAILVRDCAEVELIGVDVSGNFRQRLGSTPEREDPSDWLWPHENDEQQWRKNYGAGICVENSRKVTIRECVGRWQQNGIILDRCSHCRVYDNDMSFNSGWGLAMWRSCDNQITTNRFDWCVRGYSHGVYDRGQDSAGILVFEQCSRNVFARNSATHGGDGFFLYAGNGTLKKTGKGGCNDNLVCWNDFSHAVANAIEATFSKGNRFIENICSDSNYGIWAGYSYETRIQGNVIRDNRYAGVAIEHGEDTVIVENVFSGNRRGIQLWWDDDKDLLASAFAKQRSCLSKGYWIGLNSFDGDRVAYHLRKTTGVTFAQNEHKRCAKILDADKSTESKWRGPADVPPEEIEVDQPGKLEPFLAEHHPRGREHILVHEWGPLDPTKPDVFPRNRVGWGTVAFQVAGSAPYRIEQIDGKYEIDEDERRFTVRAKHSGIHPFRLVVHIGERSFPVEGTLLLATWHVRHWRWETDPREDPAAWRVLIKSEPLVRRVTDRLDYSWRHGGPEGVPTDGFATRAETTMELPAGRYEIRTRSDDGVRVFIDGKVVQEDWTHHGPKPNTSVVELAAGKHSIVVEHFELDGYAVLSFDLRPVP